ncbi:unnamed protein product, partial [Mesorhabditis spiculigera]
MTILYLLLLFGYGGTVPLTKTRSLLKREIVENSVDGHVHHRYKDVTIPSPWSSKSQLSGETLNQKIRRNKLLMSLPMFQIESVPTERPIFTKINDDKKPMLFPASLKRPKYVVTDDNFDRLYQKMNSSVEVSTAGDPEIELDIGKAPTSKELRVFRKTGVDIRKSPTGRGLADPAVPDAAKEDFSTEDKLSHSLDDQYPDENEDMPFSVTESVVNMLEFAAAETTTISSELPTTIQGLDSSPPAPPSDNEAVMGMGRYGDSELPTTVDSFESTTVPTTSHEYQYAIKGDDATDAAPPASEYHRLEVLGHSPVSPADEPLLQPPPASPYEGIRRNPYEFEGTALLDKAFDREDNNLGLTAPIYEKEAEFTVTRDPSGRDRYIVSGTSIYRDSRVDGTVAGIYGPSYYEYRPESESHESDESGFFDGSVEKRARGEKSLPVAIPLSKDYLTMINDGQIDPSNRENYEKSNQLDADIPTIYMHRNGSKVVEERRELINGKEVSVNLTNPVLHGHDLLLDPGAIIHANLNIPRMRYKMRGAKTQILPPDEGSLSLSKAKFVGLQGSDVKKTSKELILPFYAKELFN